MTQPELFMSILNRNIRDFVAHGQRAVAAQISQKVANVNLLVCENDGGEGLKMSKMWWGLEAFGGLTFIGFFKIKTEWLTEQDNGFGWKN